MPGLSRLQLGQALYLQKSVDSYICVVTFDFPAIVPENVRTLIPVLNFLHFTDWFPTDIDLLIDDYLFPVITADLVLLQNKVLESLKLEGFQEL